MIRVEESISFECSVRFLKFFFFFMFMIIVKLILFKMMREEMMRLIRMLWEWDIKLLFYIEKLVLLKVEIEWKKL